MFDHDHPIHHRLLRLINEHRFVTTHQLLRLTESGYGSNRSALRQTLRHLNTLRTQHLIVRLERRIGGWQGGSQVSIWTLTTKGHRRLTGSTDRKRPHHYSTTFLEHLLAITETRVVLHETAAREHLTVHLTGEPACWRRYLGTHGMTQTLRPDLALSVTSAEFVDRYFIEIDRATENPARVIRKCWQYEQHRRSGTEQEHHGVYPAVIWLVPTLQRREQLRRHIDAEPRLPHDLFTVITINELPALIRDGPPTGAQ